VDAGDGFGGEVLGGEQDQVGGAAVGVVDEVHDAVISDHEPNLLVVKDSAHPVPDLIVRMHQRL
jgi:hypothetical protein